jgi:hypothetical protein
VTTASRPERGLILATAVGMDLRIPRRHGHYVFGVIQSGLTCLVAAGIATLQVSNGQFVEHWLLAWLFSWATMLPVVLLAAPFIRALVHHVTRDEQTLS